MALARVVGYQEAADYLGHAEEAIRAWDRRAHEDPELGLMVDRHLESSYRLGRPLIVTAQTRLLRSLTEIADAAADRAREDGPDGRILKELRIAIQALSEIGLTQQVIDARTHALAERARARALPGSGSGGGDVVPLPAGAGSGSDDQAVDAELVEEGG